MVFTSVWDVVLTFGPCLFLAWAGIMFKFFPDSLPYQKYRTYDDPERYIKRRFANYSWANLTFKQWEYAKRIAPKIFFVTATINLVLVLILKFFIHNIDNTVYVTVQALFAIVPHIYLVKKAEKYIK